MSVNVLPQLFKCLVRRFSQTAEGCVSLLAEIILCFNAEALFYIR